MSWTRRNLLAALPSAAAVASTGVKAAPSTTKVDVVVIGAGLAGLNAALNLEDQGLRALVLEAQPTPGGRLHTIRRGDHVLDCGATTIGPEYGRVRALAARFEVPLIPPHRRGGMAWQVNGQLGAAKDWATSPANKTTGFEHAILPAQLEPATITRFAKLSAPDEWRSPEAAQWDIPLDAYYRQCGLSDEAIRLIAISSNCEDLATTSAVFQMKELLSISTWGAAGGQKNSVYEAGAEDFHYIDGGSDRLPAAIVKGMKSEVRCSTPVSAIAMTAKGCTVTCADGSKITCQYVISAVPLTALAKIAITPKPTGLRAESIDKALYMGTSHFFFEVLSPYWEKDGVDPGLITDGGIERVFANIGPSGKVEMLDVWINGAGATRFDKMPADQAIMAVTEELYRLRPSTRGAVRFVATYSWANNPWITGNKHIFQPGQVTRFGQQIADPWQRMHFAGEHTRDIEPGMEAAAATGERAAFEILERMGKA
jgi:monoamine oxidase